MVSVIRTCVISKKYANRGAHISVLEGVVKNNDVYFGVTLLEILDALSATFTNRNDRTRIESQVHLHGFIAATSIKEQGKVTRPDARVIVTLLSSSG